MCEVKEGQSGRMINVRQAEDVLVAKVKLSTEQAVKKRTIAAGKKGSVSIRDYSMERQWKKTHWGGFENERRRKEKVCKSRRLSPGAPPRALLYLSPLQQLPKWRTPSLTNGVETRAGRAGRLGVQQRGAQEEASDSCLSFETDERQESRRAGCLVAVLLLTTF